MTNREVVLQQISHRETTEVPYRLGIDDDVATRLDEYYGDESWRDRLKTYLVSTGNIAKSEDEVFDDDHYRDRFGVIWRTDELPPSVVEVPLKEPSLEGYHFPTVEEILDPDAIDTARDTIASSPDLFTIARPGICLWACWYLRGFENTLMDVVAEEDFFVELLDRLTELTLGVIDAGADIPADAMMIGDDWGNQRGVLVGPDRWRRLFKPRYARIFDAIHAQGKVTIAHSCGSVAEIMGDLIEIGLDVLESVQPEAAGMNPYGLKTQWGDRITFWGGLGSQSTLPFGTADEVRQEIRRLRSEMSKGGGYILAPAKPLRTETPTENAVAAIEEFTAG